MVLALLIQSGLWPAVLYRRVSGPGSVPAYEPGRCRTCQYDLSGLNESPVCPECGALYVPPPMKTAFWLELREDRFRYAPAIWGTSLAAAMGTYWITLLLAMVPILWLGHNWSTALFVARRDLSHDEFPVLWPVAILIGLAPLLCKPRRNKRPVAAFFVGLAITLAASIALLALRRY